MESKQTLLSYQTECISIKRPLEWVHTDLCEPISNAFYNGKRDMLIFIDDFTYFTVAYMLKDKSEVLKHCKILQSMAEAHFNLKS